MLDYYDVQPLEIPAYLKGPQANNPIIARFQTTAIDDATQLLKELLPWWENECGSSPLCYLAVRDVVFWCAVSRDGYAVTTNAYVRNKARKNEYRVSVIYGFGADKLSLYSGAELKEAGHKIYWNTSRIQTHISKLHSIDNTMASFMRHLDYSTPYNREPQNIVEVLLALTVFGIKDSANILHAVDRILPRMSYEECEIVVHAKFNELADANSQPMQLLQKYGGVDASVVARLRKAIDGYFQATLNEIHVPGV